MGLFTGTQKNYYQGSDHGNYQFTSLDNVIDQFLVAYVGEEKLISKAKRSDVAFHAQRALQELSFDTFKSTKAQEISVPSTLQMILPHDYVNYVKLSWSDAAGIEHVLYPAIKTSNPKNIQQNTDGTYDLVVGERYGIDPKHAQVNGSFYIDELAGKIHFSSNVSGKTLILEYISDSLGTDSEMKVHKFAEEAM